MLKVLIRKKLSKKTIFDEIISKFKKITEKKINAIWKINLFLGDINIFLSEKIPIKETEITTTKKIRFVKLVC